MVETTTDGKGQELAGRGLARGGYSRGLTAAEFQGLSAVPAEAEWFANIDNPRTRRAYRIDIHEIRTRSRSASSKLSTITSADSAPARTACVSS